MSKRTKRNPSTGVMPYVKAGAVGAGTVVALLATTGRVEVALPVGAFAAYKAGGSMAAGAVGLVAAVALWKAYISSVDSAQQDRARAAALAHKPA